MKKLKQFKGQELSKSNLRRVKGGGPGSSVHGSGRFFYDFDGCYYTIMAVEYYA